MLPLIVCKETIALETANALVLKFVLAQADGPDPIAINQLAQPSTIATIRELVLDQTLAIARLNGELPIAFLPFAML